MAGVSFGFTLPQRGILFGVATLDQMLQLAGEVDRCPLFDSIWVGDSLLAKPRPDSLTLLGSLTATTRRVLLGVGCLASFPIRDPLVFAYQWASLDLMSNGRMLLAVCTGLVGGGTSAREGLSWGVADRERVSRLEENILICRRLWSENEVSIQGTFRAFERVTLRPRPVQQPCPIWIASNPRSSPERPGLVEGALRRVARMADGWMSVELTPRMFAANWAMLRKFLEQEGRDPNAFPNALYHNVNVNEDRTAALAETQRFLDEYYGPVFGPRVVDSWTAAGSPAECIESLRRLARDGARRITLRITSWNQEAQYARLVQEVLPHVNEP